MSFHKDAGSLHKVKLTGVHGGASYPQSTESKFNAADYLKDHMDVLPKASVEACKTKEDCDALLNRLGLK